MKKILLVQKQKREKNIEESRRKNRESYYRNIEKRLKQAKKYRILHKEEIKLYRDIYKKNNIKVLKIKNKKYRELNPEKLLQYGINHIKKYSGIYGIKYSKYNYAKNNWAKSVKKRDNYKCQVCFKEAVISHHILHKSKYPLLSLNLNNGISLCKSCHNEVHERFVLP